MDTLGNYIFQRDHFREKDRKRGFGYILGVCIHMLGAFGKEFFFPSKFSFLFDN
jgi:hypothetical protein